MATAAEPILAPTSNRDGNTHHEIINGQNVETPRMGSYEALIASDLFCHLSQHARRHERGLTVVEILFQFDAAGKLKRRPDLAFVSCQRWPRGRKPAPADGWNVVPDLAVEVVSPGNSANELTEKPGHYFRAGVRLVWVVHPLFGQVHVFESPAAVRILQVGDDLDCGDVLPGFRLPLATLFEDEGTA